ncbi:MAG TPA: uracil phosphoribosyltransferase [Chthonomonadales bacterium]|nr:uracil phosphoribosyltransferase [Chthonomonadales bacterium]
MPLYVVDHPLALHYLTHLRDQTTKPALFRTLARKISTVLAIEALRDLRMAQLHIRTPMEETWAPVLDEEIVVVPILRSGLCMLDAVVELLPDVTVGYIGLERDERTAVAGTYYRKLPALAGRTALVLDPMLATGGSATSALRHLVEGGCSRVALLCVVAAPEGIRAVETEHPGVRIVTAAVDRGLDERKYIVPGLGDFGDRLYGTR